MHTARPSRDHEPIAPIRRIYDGKVLPGLQVNTFRNIDRVFPSRVVRRSAQIRPIPHRDEVLPELCFESNGKVCDLYDYVSCNRVGGLLVLKNGAIVVEQYELGNTERTRWMSMSMAKSVSSTLVGAAIQDGYIGSIDDPVTDYVRELAGSAYEGATIRHVLQMSSGVRWNETATDPLSDRRRMLELQIAQQPGAILAYLARLPRAADPGTVWNYSTGETHVVGAILRSAIGRPVAEYLSEKIWSRLGMEADATWWLESPHGLEVAGSGLNATLRDYGRFGLFIMNDGVIDGQRVLPEGWVKEAGSPRVLGGNPVDYGYMWWPVPGLAGSHAAGAFRAGGLFGQYIYINPRDKVVIVVWSARSKPRGAEAIADNDFFNAVVAALQ